MQKEKAQRDVKCNASFIVLPAKEQVDTSVAVGKNISDEVLHQRLVQAFIRRRAATQKASVTAVTD